MSYTKTQPAAVRRKPIAYGVLKGLLTAFGFLQIKHKYPYGTYVATDRFGRQEVRYPIRGPIDWLS